MTIRQALILRELIRAGGWVQWRELAEAGHIGGASENARQVQLNYAVRRLRAQWGQIIIARRWRGYRISEYGWAQLRAGGRS